MRVGKEVEKEMCTMMSVMPVVMVWVSGENVTCTATFVVGEKEEGCFETSTEKKKSKK